TSTAVGAASPLWLVSAWSPKMNALAGMSAMPRVAFTPKRKYLPGAVLETVKAVTGTASVAFTQLVEARLVVLCRKKLGADDCQKRMVWLPAGAMPKLVVCAEAR